VWQSAAAGLTLFFILFVFSRVIELVIVAAAGATTFTVFALPHHGTAQPRNVIGGHVIGIAVGFACSFLPLIPSGSLAVGLSTLLMVPMDAEHPPAAGTALGLVVFPSLGGAAFILAAAIGLSLARLGLASRMRDLM